MLVFAVVAASVSLYLVSGQLDQYSADAGAGGDDGGLEVNIPGNKEGPDIKSMIMSVPWGEIIALSKWMFTETERLTLLFTH